MKSAELVKLARECQKLYDSGSYELRAAAKSTRELEYVVCKLVHAGLVVPTGEVIASRLTQYREFLKNWRPGG